MGRTDATTGIGTPSLAVDSTAMVEAELLSIGSELLLGETVDTNAAYLARELATTRHPAAPRADGAGRSRGHP